MPFMPIIEFEQFFSNDFTIVLGDDDINLIDKIDAKMVRILFMEDRDELKFKARNQLLRNTHRLTIAPLMINNKQEPSTVQSLLRDYNASVGGTGLVETINQTQYLARVTASIQSGTEDRKILRRLIDVYEHLKLSSQKARGLEERVSFVIDGRKKILADGRVEDIRVNEVTQMIEDAKKIQVTEEEGFDLSNKNMENIRYMLQIREQLINVEDAPSKVVKLQPEVERSEGKVYEQERKLHKTTRNEENLVGGVAIVQSIKKLSEVTEQLDRAIETTTDTVSELPNVIEDAGSRLDDFIEALEDRVREFGESTDERESKASEQLGNIAKDLRKKLQRSAAGTGPSQQAEQNLLIFQLRQLTNVLKKSGGQKASQVVKTVREQINRPNQ